jgi:hypothetical protein
MAIVNVIETAANRGVSGRVRESSRYTRSFMVKTDNPAEPMANVMAAVGIQVGYYHPEDTSVIATEFDCKPTGDLLMFEVVWSYEAPPASDTLENGGTQPPPPTDPDNPGGRPVLTLPADVWSGGTSVTAVPCFKDRFGDIMKNTAGTPIPELQMDYAFATLQLTRCFGDFTALQPVFSYTNQINSAPWAGGAAGTWKCQGGSWSRETQANDGTTLTFYKCQLTFAYDARGWLIEQVNVGFQKLENGERVPIKDSDGNYVSEPAALDLAGQPIPPGSNDSVILQFEVYGQSDFASIFGQPI